MNFVQPFLGKLLVLRWCFERCGQVEFEWFFQSILSNRLNLPSLRKLGLKDCGFGKNPHHKRCEFEYQDIFERLSEWRFDSRVGEDKHLL